ncbi:rhodanese-related sulfurtransferase [Paenibacillus sp. GSMTC-2017]|uniref:oxygen-dependent tRNA uridine(34) hydroxylase TrhO n=1 Tax=Paenibacillus sp. GSMTC-2017 TaxID=2794350 RepID=UPI0018D7CA20|nr:rhodanese-related sulfurtransferase [Paenibacillus sp. GSMTC-2017]MBH5316210.1 rhodanese-related sulfurtransferase [Paenibacillus sp. GSMTC-2017]
MESLKPYRILLYYKYVTIPDYEIFAAQHLDYCKQLGIKGRILIAEQGINGTLSGTIEQTDAYIAHMQSNPLFADMVYKIDESEGHAFKKLFVRPKKELVTLRYDTKLDPNVISGKRLTPEQFHEQLQRDDVIIIDGRNDYEYDLGHFRNAIRPTVESFREFPEWIRENLSDAKDKTILTYCTGGIRCETLTGVLLNEGYTDVAQLEGGITTYGKDPVVQGRLFDGKMYVFDERISVRINQTDEDIIVGKCYHCENPTDVYINCADDLCHLQHLVCDDCMDEHDNYCSDDCRTNDLERKQA